VASRGLSAKAGNLVEFRHVSLLPQHIPSVRSQLIARLLADHGAGWPVPALCQTAAPAAPPSAAPPPAVTPELRVFDPSLIDKTVDPCENFYRYSCNGWFKRNPLPADQTRYGRFTELYELNRLHLRQILEEAAAPAAARIRARRTSRRSATSTQAAWTRRR
jgi:hypothetical protein